MLMNLILPINICFITISLMINIINNAYKIKFIFYLTNKYIFLYYVLKSYIQHSKPSFNSYIYLIISIKISI